MSGRRTKQVALDSGLTLHCEFAGSGPRALIFIPGWAMSSAVFERQLDHFAQSDVFTAVSYDPRGQGRSSKPLDGHYYAQRGRDLGRLIGALGFNEVILAGWSYGVLDLLAYVRAFGLGRIRAAVVIDGAPRGLGADPAKDWVWESPKQHIEGNSVLRTLETRATVNRGLAEWCLESTDERDLSWLQGIMNETPDAIAALINEAAIYSDYEAELVRLCSDRPVLILCREEWHAVVTNWIAAHAVPAQCEFFGKHMMFWDRAPQFNARLDRFLAEK
ncbi:MAG: alpha/beta hydrolase [Hyphomicrobiales bacterium]